MGITVERKGGYLKVETDQPDGDVLHAMIHKDVELRTAMEVSGINRIEVKGDDRDLYNVESAFDDAYKEKTGRNWFKVV